MQAIRTGLDKGLVFICVVLFMMMTVVGTYQIVTRYFFNSPSTVSEEIITYSFTWLSILSASYVFGTRGHLCMTFVYGKFRGKKRVILDMFAEVLVILTALLLLLYGGLIMVEENFAQETASLRVSMGLMYAVLPISGVLITVYGLLNLFDQIRLFGSPEVASYGVPAEDEHPDQAAHETQEGTR